MTVRRSVLLGSVPVRSRARTTLSQSPTVIEVRAFATAREYASGGSIPGEKLTCGKAPRGSDSGNPGGAGGSSGLPRSPREAEQDVGQLCVLPWSSGAQREMRVTQDRPSRRPTIVSGTTNTLDAVDWSAKAKVPNATNPDPGSPTRSSIRACSPRRRHRLAAREIRAAPKGSRGGGSPKPAHPP